MKVSVIIPLYNKAQFIWETIESSQVQDIDAEIELCIYDDCSTDGSFEVAIKCCADLFTRGAVHIERGEVNKGTAYATNRAMEMATSDYIFYLGADDLCHPQRFSRQLGFMIATNSQVVDAYLMYEFEDGDKPTVLRKPTTIESKMECARSGKNPMNGGTMLWRRDVYDTLVKNDGYFFNENLRHAEDVEFAFRCVSMFACRSCPHILYIARRGSHNKTAWKANGLPMPKRRKEDLNKIELIRDKLFGEVKRKGKRGVFLN